VARSWSVVAVRDADGTMPRCGPERRRTALNETKTETTRSGPLAPQARAVEKRKGGASRHRRTGGPSTDGL